MRQSDYPNFDPVFCGKAIKYGAVGSVAVLILTVSIMLAVDSSSGRCPGWYAGSPQPLWVMIVLVIAPAVAVIVYQARHWSSVVDRIIHGEPEPAVKFPKTPIEKVTARYQTDESRKQLQYNRLFVVISVGWTLFCAVPLFLMAGYCVNWPLL